MTLIILYLLLKIAIRVGAIYKMEAILIVTIYGLIKLVDAIFDTMLESKRARRQ